MLLFRWVCARHGPDCRYWPSSSDKAWRPGYDRAHYWYARDDTPHPITLATVEV